MKKITVICAVLIMLLSVYSVTYISEPERCSLCDDLARHAPCIVNLSTGEKLELEVYEPHPFLVGEIAEEQRGGYFTFIRDAGVEGYKLGADSVTITIPVKSDIMNQRYFCLSCRELLSAYAKQSYVIVDLKNTEKPGIYAINSNTIISFRCYDISVQEIKEDGQYKITITGTLNDSESAET